MLRRIVRIDRDRCTGCGLCVDACHEGAIGLDKEGKAYLLRDDYCDGLGDCLPACPADAISFETREALAYDEEAVLANMTARGITLSPSGRQPGTEACPGSAVRALRPMGTMVSPVRPDGSPQTTNPSELSSLRQWPVQIKLVPVNAPYFNGADLLIAADCSAYAYGKFHDDFMAGKVTLIGCPKLDGVDYSQKLEEILSLNNIRSITLARMTVPCCGGLEQAVKNAIRTSGKDVPLTVAVISPEGRIAC